MARVAVAVASRGAERFTVRDIAGDVGAGTASVWDALLLLRSLGLVDWQDDHRGTMRSTSRVVAASW